MATLISNADIRSHYLDSFNDLSSPFLQYYDKTSSIKTYTRGEFLSVGFKAALKLKEIGVKKGDKVLHYFTENTVEDLAFRTASVIIGCIPVTVNW
jgi:acyl-coenzyme A synthetase/AMP-(fatty) acid ligase